MTRFLARQGVEARFGCFDFGEVDQLDVGEFDDPTQLGMQCYTFNHEARRGIVRFVGKPAPRSLLSSLDELVLQKQGAEYRVQAVCTGEVPRDGSVDYQFEAEAAPRITESARQRHGVDCLATALLLDALAEED